MISVNIEKTSTLEYISLEVTDIINYTIIVTNNGNEAINTMKVYDVPSQGITMISSSVLIDNQPAGNYLLNDNSIIIPYLRPQNNVIITFEAKVDRSNPISKSISWAIATFFDRYGNSFQIKSNECIVEVIDINIMMDKQADRLVSKIGDTIGYTIFIRNNSNVPLLEVTFFEEWPPELDLLNDCLLVNGEETYRNLEELAQGIFLNVLEPGESVIITFYGTVISMPPCSIVSNRAYINYEYVVPDPKLANRFIKGTAYTNYADVRINN